MTNVGLKLIAPRVTPALDPFFRPAALANRAYRERVGEKGVPIRLALEQADGSVFRFETRVFPEGDAEAASNFTYMERLIKFLLWSRGAWRIHFDGPAYLHELLQRHYRESTTGKFDAEIMGARIYEKPFEIVMTREIPEARESTAPVRSTPPNISGSRVSMRSAPCFITPTATD
jgi:hypothetical protein